MQALKNELRCRKGLADGRCLLQTAWVADGSTKAGMEESLLSSFIVACGQKFSDKYPDQETRLVG